MVTVDVVSIVDSNWNETNCTKPTIMEGENYNDHDWSIGRIEWYGSCIVFYPKSESLIEVDIGRAHTTYEYEYVAILGTVVSSAHLDDMEIELERVLREYGGDSDVKFARVNRRNAYFHPFFHTTRARVLGHYGGKET